MHGTVHISDHEQEIAKLFIQVVEQQKLFLSPSGLVETGWLAYTAHRYGKRVSETEQRGESGL